MLKALLCKILLLISSLFIFSTLVLCEDKQVLPYCGVANSNRYIFVSTLDGKLTALNAEGGGSVAWTIHPGDEPMLSSSIHNLELTNYGQLVRMIPSLTGGLYKFNGDSIEPIPVTADNLLQSSFRYSDDLVISGGKESHTWGVSLETGAMLYECSMKGCSNISKPSEASDVLVVQRLGQVVRAVEPRTGSERWNFSVAQHDLKLVSNCHDHARPRKDFEIKVIVPEGLICAVDMKDPAKILWKHKFDAPVVHAWQSSRGSLLDVDLFSGSKHGDMGVVPFSPSLYIGMHEKQLYIQESVTMLKQREELASRFRQHLISSEKNTPSIPWKPVPVTSNVAGLLEGSKDSDSAVEEVGVTALSVLYASPYVDGSGFYLYTDEDWKKTHKGHCNVTIHPEDEDEEEEREHDDEDDTPVQIVIVSLWYWWREVVVISLTTAVLFNLMVTRRFHVRVKVVEPTGSTAVNVEVAHDGSGDRRRVESESQPEFTSRYLTDFEPVNRLGKGGFGVVFKARNKIDDCEYAIKRITLPNHEQSREKVMREVKALAKLDHHHIVRYFNAWLEFPPPGWQEDQDRSWIHSNSLENTLSKTGLSEGQKHSLIDIPTDSSARLESSVFLNLNCSSTTESELSLDKQRDKTDCSDSFIVFGQTSKSVTFARGYTSSDEATESERKRRGRPNSLELSESSLKLAVDTSRIYLYIQMQLCQQQSLKDWLMLNTEREYNSVIKMFEQIVEAVEYVHMRFLIHRDLKPSNIFFSMDGQIKVGDFGLATAMYEGGGRQTPCDSSKSLCDEKHTAQVGTHLYMSPEQLSGKAYDYKVDIYSLGLILFELLVPFSTQMERLKVLQCVKEHDFTQHFQDGYKDEVSGLTKPTKRGYTVEATMIILYLLCQHELLKLMLSKSPEERPTTYGIRARQPLKSLFHANGHPVEDTWHFDLPPRRLGFSKTSLTSSSSGETVLQT